MRSFLYFTHFILESVTGVLQGIVAALGAHFVILKFSLCCWYDSGRLGTDCLSFNSTDSCWNILMNSNCEASFASHKNVSGFCMGNLHWVASHMYHFAAFL